MRESKQSQAVISTHGIKNKGPSMQKNHTFDVRVVKVSVLRREIRESLRKKTKMASDSVNEGTVSEACVFERFNVNLRSARGIKS